MNTRVCEFLERHATKFKTKKLIESAAMVGGVTVTPPDVSNTEDLSLNACISAKIRQPWHDFDGKKAVLPSKRNDY